MLTKVELRVVQVFVKLATWIPILPLDWVNESQRLRPTVSKIKYYTVLFNLFQSVAYLGFIIARFIPGFAYDYKNGERKKIIVPFTFHLYFFLKESISMFAQYFMFTRARSYCEWFNRLENFNQNYGTYG